MAGGRDAGQVNVLYFPAIIGRAALLEYMLRLLC
jgi:hypothetical protein